jgi:hypothetical protein
MADIPQSGTDYARRHLRFGWWSLLVFAALGLLLESLQGFKVGAYLDVSNETRRLLWRLAHAHGTLLSIVHVLFGLNVRSTAEGKVPKARAISLALTGASVLIPAGFFLGGFGFVGGDPGLAVLLVPVGAILLFFALFSLGASAAITTAPAKPSRPRER